ncbi:MAG: ATP-dependent zinc metalloprotease FtsH [Candidatus Gracilibacteria bacterium]|jgi:cell division protease FtsH|nr:ATP-dependent zinc metalloprotease FtsH [Candidatus Gracilibacteria bacterium]
MKNKNSKSPWFTFIAVIFVLTALWATLKPEDFFAEQKKIETVSVSEMTKLYSENKIEKIEVKGKEIAFKLKDGEIKKTFKEENQNISDLGLLRDDVDTQVEVVDTSASEFFVGILGDILPFVIIVAILVFMMKQVQKGAGNNFSFAKSKARLFSVKGKKTTFKDVAGCTEAKNELEEIVDFLKHPKKFTDIGAKIPKGVMLVGSPGTGKTLLAKAVAGEANVPFFSISGSEFVEMFVGVGASRVRDLFEKAKKNSPAIIFIDEIDAVGRQRGVGGMSGGHDEREQTLNQILSEMDGFEDNANVIVMAATNRPDVLDKALMRPGRFDRRVIIDKPDLKDRIAILEVHTKGKKMGKNIDLEKIGQMTAGFAGAELANIMNEAAIYAGKSSKKSISQKDLVIATEKVIMGPERKSRILNSKDKKVTAYHEAGHAIVAHLLETPDPVHKVTIIPRGMSLGSTWSIPEGESFNYTKTKLKEEICVLLGGFVAESLTFGEPATGATNDLERATKIAKNMVTKFGMSSIGPISFSDSGNSFLGVENGIHQDISEETAKKIDKEVHGIVNEALVKTEKILKDNKNILKEISEALLEKETLDSGEFKTFFK